MGVITEFLFQKVIKCLIRNEGAILVSIVGGGEGLPKGQRGVAGEQRLEGGRGMLLSWTFMEKDSFRRRKCSIVLDTKEGVLKMSIHSDNWKVTCNLDKAPVG